MNKRLEVMKFISNWIEGINPDNGYPDFDLRKKVYRGRDRFGADFADRLPYVSILEAKATDYGKFANEEETVRLDDWVLLVQGYCVDDARNPTDPAYEMVAVVEGRLAMLIEKDEQGQVKYPGVYRMGGLIATLTLAKPVVRPPEEGLSDTAFFYLPIRVGIEIDIRNP